jgi:hypothetical protein
MKTKLKNSIVEESKEMKKSEEHSLKLAFSYNIS